jgi:hypothetical protein
VPRLHRCLPALAAALLPVVLASPAYAEKVDVVVLRNGSRVVGEVRSLSRSRLELKTDDMGATEGAPHNDWGLSLALGYSF